MWWFLIIAATVQVVGAAIGYFQGYELKMATLYMTYGLLNLIVATLGVNGVT